MNVASRLVKVSGLVASVARRQARGQYLFLFDPSISLLHQFSRDDPEHFLDPFAIFGADLMTAIPADVLSPEPAATFAIDTLPKACTARRHGRAGHRCRTEVVRHISNTPFKWNFPSAGILCHHVTLRPHHMDDHILAQMALQFHQPATHLFKALFIYDAVHEQHRRRAPVVQLGNAAKSFLAGRIPYLQTNGRTAVDIKHSFNEERCADRRRGLSWVESAVHVPVDQGGLPHAYLG